MGEKSGGLLESLFGKGQDSQIPSVPQRTLEGKVISGKVKTEGLWAFRHVSQKRAQMLMKTVGLNKSADPQAFPRLGFQNDGCHQSCKFEYRRFFSGECD